jgi:hypothetical protein
MFELRLLQNDAHLSLSINAVSENACNFRGMEIIFSPDRVSALLSSPANGDPPEQSL